MNMVMWYHMKSRNYNRSLKTYLVDLFFFLNHSFVVKAFPKYYYCSILPNVSLESWKRSKSGWQWIHYLYCCAFNALLFWFQVELWTTKMVWMTPQIPKNLITGHQEIIFQRMKSVHLALSVKKPFAGLAQEVPMVLQMIWPLQMIAPSVMLEPTMTRLGCQIKRTVSSVPLEHTEIPKG